MDVFCEEFLSGAAFPGDQNIQALVLRSAPGQGVALPGGGVLADNVLGEEVALLVAPDLLNLFLEADLGQDVLDRGVHFREVYGLGQKVPCPEFQGLHGGLHRAVAGDHDDRAREVHGLEALHELDAVDAREVQVEEDEVRDDLCDRLEGLFRRVGHERPVALPGNEALQGAGDEVVVIDDVYQEVHVAPFSGGRVPFLPECPLL